MSRCIVCDDELPAGHHAWYGGLCDGCWVDGNKRYRAKDDEKFKATTRKFLDAFIEAERELIPKPPDPFDPENYNLSPFERKMLKGMGPMGGPTMAFLKGMGAEFVPFEGEVIGVVEEDGRVDEE